MKTLIGGAIGTVLGIIGLAVWFNPFLQLLAGTVPSLLLLGGCLALYLGFDELKNTWQNEAISESSLATDNKDKEISELKQELENIKNS